MCDFMDYIGSKNFWIFWIYPNKSHHNNVNVTIVSAISKSIFKISVFLEALGRYFIRVTFKDWFLIYTKFLWTVTRKHLIWRIIRRRCINVILMVISMLICFFFVSLRLFMMNSNLRWILSSVSDVHFRRFKDTRNKKNSIIIIHFTTSTF